MVPASLRTELAACVFIASLLSGAGVVIWQIHFYLKHGTWPHVSVINALDWMGYMWAHNPQSWFGLNQLLSYVPLSGFLVVGGVYLGTVMAKE